MKQTIDAYTLYPAGALQHMSTCLPSTCLPSTFDACEMDRYKRSAPRFVYRVREAGFRVLYEHLLYSMHVQFLIRQGKLLLQSGRREADPNIISAGQFPPARPEQDSPHLCVNASPPNVDSGSGFPTTSAWSYAFFSFFFCGLILFSLFRYSHHLAETAANW